MIELAMTIALGVVDDVDEYSIIRSGNAVMRLLAFRLVGLAMASKDVYQPTT